MNEYHKKIMLVLNEIEGNGLPRSEALQLLMVAELSRLNDSMDYLKRAVGNIDNALTDR